MVKSYLADVSRAVEEWLNTHFNSQSEATDKLYESMKYSLFAGGKKLRPAVLIMGYNLFKETAVNAIHPAMAYGAAVEMIHTYSLIHDDLPGMDNDGLRRGKPTNHMVYGEATAILAGDGLLTKAFEIFADCRFNPGISGENCLKASLIMLKAVGPDGMVGGQYADMMGQGQREGLPESAMPVGSIYRNPEALVNYVHAHKTASFISGCVQAGAALTGAAASDLDNLRIYGDRIGVAFQIIDDILDVTSTTDILGKPAGSDEDLDKLTYPKIYGLEESRKIASSLVEEAVQSVSRYGTAAEPLRALAAFVGSRSS